MKEYIDKSDLVAEIERRMKLRQDGYRKYNDVSDFVAFEELEYLHDEFIPTLEVKEIQKKKLYVVTRCEEHSDYVEKAFFNEKKADEYCKQFEGNENAYGRDITEIEVDCLLEVKEVDFDDFGFYWGEYVSNLGGDINNYEVAKYFYELGLEAQKEE